MSYENLHDGFPSLLKSLDALFELCILPLTRLLTFLLFAVMPDICALEGRKGQACAELPILLFKLGNTALEGAELCFAFIAGVLGSDTV